MHKLWHCQIKVIDLKKCNTKGFPKVTIFLQIVLIQYILGQFLAIISHYQAFSGVFIRFQALSGVFRRFQAFFSGFRRFLAVSGGF